MIFRYFDFEILSFYSCNFYKAHWSITDPTSNRTVVLTSKGDTETERETEGRPCGEAETKCYAAINQGTPGTASNQQKLEAGKAALL